MEAHATSHAEPQPFCSSRQPEQRFCSIFLQLAQIHILVRGFIREIRGHQVRVMLRIEIHPIIQADVVLVPPLFEEIMMVLLTAIR